MSTSAGRILVAGVGYDYLRDMSFGPLLIARLREETWPEGVEIEDLSYGPVAVMHNLEARPAYDRMVFVAGVERTREPGTVHAYQWTGELPGDDEVQARVAEAVTGVISLQNLLVVATYFKRLPEDVSVIEVEAGDTGWGAGLTTPVEAAIPEVIERIRAEIARPVGDAAPSRLRR